MKAAITLFCLFLMANMACAQEFCPPGARWIYCRTDCPFCSMPPVFGIDTIDFVGFQTVQGRNCKKLKSNYGEEYFLYQDSSKVFYYNETVDSFSLLYDLAIQPGGQFLTPRIIPFSLSIDNISVAIAEKDTQTVNGLELVFFRGRLNCEPGAFGDTIIYNDRFGANDRISFLIYPLQECIIDPGITRKFRSYEDPVFGVYMPEAITCPITSSTADLRKEEGLALFPNPTSDILNVRLPTRQPSKVSSFRIVNYEGRALKEVKTVLGQESYSIPVGEYVPGIYMLLLLENGGVKAAGRFLVVR